MTIAVLAVVWLGVSLLVGLMVGKATGGEVPHSSVGFDEIAGGAEGLEIRPLIGSSARDGLHVVHMLGGTIAFRAERLLSEDDGPGLPPLAG